MVVDYISEGLILWINKSLLSLSASVLFESIVQDSKYDWVSPLLSKGTIKVWLIPSLSSIIAPSIAAFPYHDNIVI